MRYRSESHPDSVSYSCSSPLNGSPSWFGALHLPSAIKIPLGELESALPLCVQQHRGKEAERHGLGLGGV